MREIYEWRRWDNPRYPELRGATLYVCDCGGGGDCQFLCLSRALRADPNRARWYSVAELRALVGESFLLLSDDDFQMRLLSYRLEREKREFVGSWDPAKCHTRGDLAQAVVTHRGFGFQGDDVTLSALACALNLAIIVLNENRHGRYVCQPPRFDRVALLLFYQQGGFRHYRLLGAPLGAPLARGRAPPPVPGMHVQTLFAPAALPAGLARYVTAFQSPASALAPRAAPAPVPAAAPAPVGSRAGALLRGRNRLPSARPRYSVPAVFVAPRVPGRARHFGTGERGHSPRRHEHRRDRSRERRGNREEQHRAHHRHPHRH